MAEDGIGNPKPKKKKARPKTAKDEQGDISSSLTTNKALEQILQQAVSKSTKDALDVKKKKKKKAKSTEEDEVLQSLRKAEGIEGLRKEQDTALIANTYDPDNDTKNEKSNKQRQRRLNKKNANDDEEKRNLDENDPGTTEKKKKKKVKKQEEFIEDEIEKELAHLASQPNVEKKPRETPRKKVKSPSRQKQEDTEKSEDFSEETSLVATPGKKKKKKPKQTEDEEEESVDKEEALKNEKTELVPKTKKKKKQPKETDEEIEEEEREEEVVKTPKKKKKKPKETEETEDDEKENEAQVVKSHKKKKAKDADEELEKEDAEKAATPVKAKPRKKKGKEEDEEATRKTETEEEVEDEPKPKPRKKKKVKEEGKGDEKEAEKSEDKSVDEEGEPKTEEKKKKKKRLKASDERSQEEKAASPLSAQDIEDLGEVMALMIHRTDKLKTDFYILHPLVRVHLINEETGEYIPKQHQDRPVTSYFETRNQDVKTILPMMTQPFDFKAQKSTLPVWEDLLVFNENFNYFVQSNPKVLILFELLDFVSMNTASRQFSNQKEEGGWHRIAWAFLKVLGKNNKVNIGNKLRLQLWVPPNKTGPRTAGQPEVYQWWKSAQRVPYPSTLYVTIKSMKPVHEVSGAMRSMFATQEELGHMSYKDLKSMNWSGREKTYTSGHTLNTWNRLAGQLCRVPNNLVLTLSGGKKGCFVLKFSNDGRKLACACQDGTDFPILVYEIPSGTLKGQFQGHFGIVYDLCWNRSDTELMSASSDGTARIWDLQKFGENQTRLLPHPGFVYTAMFHPRVDSIVVTGGYDEVIRVWDISMPEDYNVLQQEMEEHHGHINSICFDNDDGQRMYSADSVGVILIWNVYVSDQAGRKHFIRDWSKYQEIRDPELKDTPINFIKMHPSGRRLLVHGRNNAIYMFDLRVQRVMQKYFGAENLKEKLCSTITPCGSFVMSGGEDGKLYAWNTDTGDQVAVYTQLNYQMPVTDVHYHPRDHMLALCSLGDNHPIYVYKYDPHISQMDATSPRPRSPVEQTSVENLMQKERTSMMESLESVRAKVQSKEEFETQEKARYHRVVKKLETATLQMSQMPGMVVPEHLLSSRMDTIGRSGIQSTWQMPHDAQYSLTPRTSSIPPGVLSPHAPPGSGTQLATQISAHRGYMRASDGDWRPGFSEMGRHGARSASPTYYGRPPHMSLSVGASNKAQFTFESSTGKTVKYKQVYVLYDYRAQRSDELNLYKGDVITILHKDNENWWMGESSDGSQGYFPANYVTEDEDPRMRRGSRAPSSTSGSTLTAVKTKSGELKFVSGGEESDTEQNRRTPKKASIDLRSSESGRSSPHRQLRDSIDALLGTGESAA